jgi:hypothetical protein
MKNKYFHNIMFADTTIAQLSNDGLIYLFESIDIVEHLSKNYPFDQMGWYFNATKDRYCAEWSGKKQILVNPSIVAFRYGMPVLSEKED